MSHTHIRVKVPPLPVKRKYSIEAAIWMVFVGLAGYWVQGRLWPDSIENTHETAMGKVLETKLVVVGNKESNYGGYILYRIEAHVTYPLRGQLQDRWMAASDATGDRTFLALQLTKQTGKCLVYWALGHAENPRCVLQ